MVQQAGNNIRRYCDSTVFPNSGTDDRLGIADARWQHITIRRELDRITINCSKFRMSQQGLTHKIYGNGP